MKTSLFALILVITGALVLPGCSDNCTAWVSRCDGKVLQLCENADFAGNVWTDVATCDRCVDDGDGEAGCGMADSDCPSAGTYCVGTEILECAGKGFLLVEGTNFPGTSEYRDTGRSECELGCYTFPESNGYAACLFEEEECVAEGMLCGSEGQILYCAKRGFAYHSPYECPHGCIDIGDGDADCVDPDVTDGGQEQFLQ